MRPTKFQVFFKDGNIYEILAMNKIHAAIKTATSQIDLGRDITIDYVFDVDNQITHNVNKMFYEIFENQ